MRVKDIMTAPALTIEADQPLFEALDQMIDDHVSGLAVVDECGHLVGVLSEGDVLRRSELGTASPPAHWFERLFTAGTAQTYRIVNGRKVSDVMSAPAITIDDMAPLSEAATTMEKHRIKRLAVTHDGDLVGVLSRADFVKALRAMLEPSYEEPATSDDEIRSRIEAELAAQPWARDCNIAVHVHDGRVTLTGSVAIDHQRRAAEVAAETVSGVRSIENMISVIEPVLIPLM